MTYVNKVTREVGQFRKRGKRLVCRDTGTSVDAEWWVAVPDSWLTGSDSYRVEWVFDDGVVDGANFADKSEAFECLQQRRSRFGNVAQMFLVRQTPLVI